jgi:hypothetical protein
MVTTGGLLVALICPTASLTVRIHLAALVRKGYRALHHISYPLDLEFRWMEMELDQEDLKEGHHKDLEVPKVGHKGLLNKVLVAWGPRGREVHKEGQDLHQDPMVDLPNLQHTSNTPVVVLMVHRLVMDRGPMDALGTLKKLLHLLPLTEMRGLTVLLNMDHKELRPGDPIPIVLLVSLRCLEAVALFMREVLQKELILTT